MRHITRLSGYQADVWQEIVRIERQELFATPERLAWIAARYSDADVGRPGLFAPSDKKLCASKSGKVRNVNADRDAPDDDAETSRTPIEFAGDKDVLEEEFAVAAD